MNNISLKIAIDFDGTIVEHKYPAIGQPIPRAFEVIKELRRKGHYLILWTYRNGKELDDAIDFCKKNGLDFQAVNHSTKEEASEWKFIYDKISRKPDADVFIDDRNVGGFLGWEKIRECILGTKEEATPISEEDSYEQEVGKKGFFDKLFGRK